MPAAEEVARPIVESGDEDARYEFRRDVEASRITAEQRAQLQAMTRNILRQNAGRDLSPVFAEPTPAPAIVSRGEIAIEDYLVWLGYVAPTGRMAATLAAQERAAARDVDQVLRAAARRAA